MSTAASSMNPACISFQQQSSSISTVRHAQRAKRLAWQRNRTRFQQPFTDGQRPIEIDTQPVCHSVGITYDPICFQLQSSLLTESPLVPVQSSPWIEMASRTRQPQTGSHELLHCWIGQGLPNTSRKDEGLDLSPGNAP